MTQPNLAFIGAGNMASALIGGLVARGFDAATIWATDPQQAALDKLQQQYGIRTSTDNAEAIAQADVVVLAVKPQVLKSVAEAMAPAVQQAQPLVISIAAGITLDSLQQWLGGNLAIVRCMPNTPALVQAGATGLYASPQVDENQRRQADAVLSAVGSNVWVEQEAQLDAVTAVSGSGPAYFFLVMEAMQAAGEQLGLPPEIAKQLTLQTALGAAQMASSSEEEAAELRRRVTSPGGTTAAALEVFEQGQLRELFATALAAAEQRSKELALELGD